MATIEFIQKRIAGKEKEIASLTKKLGRIQKAEASGWEANNPYMYSESDLRYCLKDLELARKALEKYQADLQEAENKAASRNVKVILDFLNQWKDRSRKFYQEQFEQYLVAEAEMRKLDKAYTESYYSEVRRGPSWKSYDAAYHKARADFNTTWAFLTPYIRMLVNPETHRREPAFNLERMNKDLDTEANRKYDFIIERTVAIVGTITDAANLHIGDKGDLNGYIVGTNGTAKVQTVGAGGYNIQCFHFRTLINEMK